MRVLYILAFVLWNAYSVIAQDMGSLAGKVETEDGEALFAANIRVKGPAITGPRSTITNERGSYHIDHLPPGIYEITISYIGYETIVVPGVEIRPGDKYNAKFQVDRRRPHRSTGRRLGIAQTGKSPGRTRLNCNR